MLRYRRTALATAIVASVGCIAVSAPAQTPDRGASSAKRWQAMNDCNRDAFTHFPDYTVDGAAQRAVFVRKCLRDHRLPAWSGYSAPP